MRKFIVLIILGVAFSFVLSQTVQAGGTLVHQLKDSPFQWYQCYQLGAPFGPANDFGTDVCVEYQALNSVTTRVKENKDGSTDVGWSLIQKGTADIYLWTNAPTAPGPNANGFGTATLGALLYTGPFHVEEIGQDDGNDAGCLGGTTEEPVAWMGHCTGTYSTLDFMKYHWKITGNKLYFYTFLVKEPGVYCFMDSNDIFIDGGGCPPGL